MAKLLEEMSYSEIEKWLTEEGISKEVVETLHKEEIDGISLAEFMEERNLPELHNVCPKLKDRMALRRLVEQKIHKAVEESSTPVEDCCDTRNQDTSSENQAKETHDLLEETPKAKNIPGPSKMFESEEKPSIVLMDDNEPLPNPFKLPVMPVEIQKELQTGKLTVRTMKEVAKLTVNAMRVYTTHPQKTERSRVARQLIKMYPCLADQDSDVPEEAMSQEIRSVFKERNRKRRSRDSLENPDNEHKRKITDLVKKEIKNIENLTSFGEDETSHSRHCRRMQEEYFKAEPSQVVVTDLMRVTFPFRRHYIIHESPNAKQVVEKYPFLRNVTYFKQEVEQILGCSVSETVTVMHKIKLQAEAEKGPSIRAQLEESTSNKDHDAMLGMKLIYHMLGIKKGKADINDVCRQISSNTPIEEAALSETHPVIIYNTQQAWLVVDGQVILEPTKAEAPECLVAAYYVFNIKYKPNLKHVFAFLEKTVFGKYITTPGQVTSRLYQVLSTTK